MNEENKIDKTQTKPAKDTLDENQPKGRLDIYIEIALIFILGILIGIAVKTEASKRITIGFDDYKIKPSGQIYNINQLQAEQIRKYNEANSENVQPQNGTPENNSTGSNSLPVGGTGINDAQ